MVTQLSRPHRLSWAFLAPDWLPIATASEIAVDWFPSPPAKEGRKRVTAEKTWASRIDRIDQMLKEKKGETHVYDGGKRVEEKEGGVERIGEAEVKENMRKGTIKW